MIRGLEGNEAVSIDALLPYKDIIHTIKTDNEMEIARHKEIAKGLGVELYFARPYHFWERDANENTNGMILQYAPKDTDFNESTGEMMAEAEWKYNNRPRKPLGYQTSIEYCKLMLCFNFGVRCTSK